MRLSDTLQWGIDLEPERAEAYNNQGYVYGRLRRFERAADVSNGGTRRGLRGVYRGRTVEAGTG